MMKNIILSLLLWGTALTTKAQIHPIVTPEVPPNTIVCSFGHGMKVCGTDAYIRQLDVQYPEYAVNRANLEEKTERWIATHKNDDENMRATFTIPVVFHVVYNTFGENIPDSQINAQLARLNTDFNALNTETIPTVFADLKANIGFNFVLATFDPNGLPTTGITRTTTTNTEFTDYDAVKNLVTAWDTKRYVNIWVCDLNIGVGLGSVAGYCPLPGGPPNLDGIIIDYEYVGDNGVSSLGRGLVHEMGHYFNLWHIWGTSLYNVGNCTDSDNVLDTPNQDLANLGCPTFPKTSCNNGPNGDMFMNYMDYTDDPCMFLFTKGQRSRMFAALLEYRSTLIHPESIAPSGPCPASNNLTTPVVAGAIIKYEVSDFITASNIIEPGAVALYDAKNYIVLQNGFWAKEGSSFRAVTGDGCGGDVRLATSPVLTNNTTFVATAINGFAVYPNPATDNITVSYMLEEAGDTHLYIYNVLGEIVSSQSITNSTAGTHSCNVNLDSIPEGIYLFSLITKQGIKTLRVVKN